MREKKMREKTGVLIIIISQSLEFRACASTNPA